MVTTEDVKALRDATGVSVMQCKKALEDAGGDMEKAKELLREQGAAIAAKKGDRELGAGTVASYIHGGGTIGAMVELLCETDFVAKNDEFQALARDLAMQAAATDDETLEGGAEIFVSQPYIKDTGKTIGDLVQDAIQKFGERTEVGRIVKFTI